MREKVFQAEFLRGARLHGMHVVRIPDGWSGGIGTGTRPYDLGVLHRGVYAAIELKQIRTGLSFTPRRMESHQIVALKNASDHGGSAYVVVNFRILLSSRAATALGVKKVNRTWAIPISHLDSYSVLNLCMGHYDRGVREIPMFHDNKKQICWDPLPLWDESSAGLAIPPGLALSMAQTIQDMHDVSGVGFNE